MRCFNHASLISLGNLANDIPRSGFGANRLGLNQLLNIYSQAKTKNIILKKS